ncbi:MAG TPA: DUF58 domain-containing protein [Fimbriimonadaceae bacterium]|nr:DUF58 domain-containing protein [Fimbriimonadaceae bacterium]
MTSRIASLALTTAFLFLIVVAVMLNSGTLFYMGTALVATIGAARLQAWMSVRGLTIERIVPESASLGEEVKVELTIRSERKIRRPLITIIDHLPSKVAAVDVTPSLPIAPAYGVPIRTHYKFRPTRRGKFKWSGLTVNGTDALGLVSLSKDYDVPATSTLTVLPVPIPLDLANPPSAGWGTSESENGLARGAGIEPRGIREYVHGDSMRFVHWRSTARTGNLWVKEFETGSHSAVAFFIQRSRGSDVGVAADTTLEQMCGNVAFVAQQMLRQGTQVDLPVHHVSGPWRSQPERVAQILDALAEIQANHGRSVATDLLEYAPTMPQGSVLYVLASVEEPDLPGAIRTLRNRGYEIIALLYDASKYGHSQIPPATNGDFVSSLTSAGAIIHFVEKVAAL